MVKDLKDRRDNHKEEKEGVETPLKQVRMNRMIYHQMTLATTPTTLNDND